MNYKKLQEEAKSLGIKYVGVSESNLKKAIKEEKAKNPEAPVESSSPKVDKKVNTAVIKNENKQEVRRYSIEAHGKEFAKLAEEFISSREDYTIELIEAKPETKCPNCGHVLDK